MRTSLSILLPLLSLLAPSVTAQTELECSDTGLTAYLLQLIDALYANGLTTTEALLAEITGTDAGYDLLSALFASNSTNTILVPTDSAFQMAGVWAPFGLQSERYLVDLFSLHSLQGHWGYNELPESGKGVAKSMLSVSRGNVTMAGGISKAWAQNVVMRRGDEGKVVVKTAWGDVESWSGPVHLEGYDLLDNIVLLPIDHVLSAPPNISTALTLPTTTRSANGLPMLVTAIGKVSPSGADALTGITEGGLTFFAPVDDAWVAEAWAQVDDKSLAAKVMGNHYTTNATVFSPDWIAGKEITIMTGQKLVFFVEGETSFVSLGDQKAQILRSDIALENGVLHIIDKVFLVTEAEKTTPNTVPSLAPVANQPNPNDANHHAPPPSTSGVKSPPAPVATSGADVGYKSSLQTMSAMYFTAMVGLVVWYAAVQ